MNTAELPSRRPASAPDIDGPAPTERPAAEKADADEPLGWLWTCVVDGLLHCACAQCTVHPDLIDCIEQRARGGTVTRDDLS